MAPLGNDLRAAVDESPDPALLPVHPQVAAVHFDRLRQRRDWLTERIKAKQTVGWDVEYDTAERDALTWALGLLPNHASY